MAFSTTAPGRTGAFWKVWKRSLEFQLAEKDMGDLYALAGSCAEVRVVHPDRLWVFDPAGEPKKFTEAKAPWATNGNRAAHLPGRFLKIPWANGTRLNSTRWGALQCTW